MQTEEQKRRAALLQQQNNPLSVKSIFDLRGPVFTPQQPKVASVPIQTTPTATPAAQPIIKQPATLPSYLRPAKEAYQTIPGGIRPLPQIKLPTVQPTFDKPIAESLNKNLQTFKTAQDLYQQGKISPRQLAQVGSDYANQYNLANERQQGIDILKTPVPNLVERYNTLSDPEQRGIRNKLQNLAQSYSTAQSPELKSLSDKATTYLGILTTPKSQLVQQAPTEAKQFYEQLPEVKPKQTFLGTLKDIGKAIIGAPQSTILRTQAQLKGFESAITGKSPTQSIEDAYAKGSITAEQRDYQLSQLNNQIALATGSLTGEDKGVLDRFLRGIGSVADIASYFFAPAKVAQLVAKPGLKILPTALKQAGQTSAITAAVPLAQGGIETKPYDILINGLIGGTTQFAGSALAGVTAKTIQEIKAKPFNTLQANEKILLNKEGQFHPQDPNAPVAAQQAPQAKIGAQPTPTAISTKASPTASAIVSQPSTFAQFSAAEAQKADELMNRYKLTPLQNLVAKIKGVITPDYLAVESDRQLAKAAKEIGQTLPATDSLGQAITQSRVARNIGIQYISNSPIKKIIGKYSKSPEVIRDFNVYRSLKRDVEQIQDGRAPIFTQQTLKQKQEYIKQYEKANPQAAYDLAALSKAIQAAQDLTATGKSAFVSKQELLAARTKKNGGLYKYWTPIGRQSPEDVATAQVSGYNIGTIGRQRVLQEFTANNQPLNLTFNPLTDYVITVFRQLGQSKVAKMVEERAQKGQIAGARVAYTGEQTGKLAEAKSALKLTRQEINQIKSKVKISARRERKLASELNKLQKEGLKVKLGEKPKEPIKQQRKLITYKVVGEYIKDNAPKTIDDLKTSYRIKELLLKRYGYGKIKQYSKTAKNEKEFAMQQFIVDVYNAGWEFVKQVAPDMKKSTFDNLVKQIYKKPTVIPGYVKVTEKVIGRAPSTQKVIESLIKTDSPTLVRIKNKIITREPKLAALVQDVINAKTQLEAAKSIKAGLKNEISVLTPDPTTGLQTILGLDANGRQFRIELPPEWAKLLKGLDKAQLDTGFKVARAIQEPFRQAWVGILNPAFQLSTAVWNAIWAPIISKEGIRLFGKEAVTAGFKSIFNTSEFQKVLQANGAISFGGDLRLLTSDSVADAIGAQASGVNKLKWYTELQGAKGFRRSWKAMNEWGGKIDGATRMAAATSAYNRARKAGLTKDQAIAEAVMSWNNVLPDFSNVSQAVKTIDSIIPFTAASVAGTRQTLRAIKERPGATLGKLGALTTAVAAIYGYNLSSKNGQDFYKDMIDSNKKYVLDNNLIVVLPGATKDKKTGEWSGIIKIPFPPEARPINSAVRSALLEQNYGAKTGQIALSITDFLTGKLRDSSSPAMQVYAGMFTGKDPRTGRDIWDATMNDQQKSAAIVKYLQANLGAPGAMTSGDAWNTFVDSFVNRVYGAKGSTPASRYYMTENKAIKDIGLNKNELNAYYGTISPSKKDLSGNIIKDKTYYDAASKATTYLRYPQTFKVSKAIDAANRANGEPGDPLFDLTPEQQQVVLNIQRLKDTQDAKALGVLNKSWLDAYYQKRTEYFDKILSEDAKKSGGIDPMGLTIPIATQDLQNKITQANQLTGADKAQYYADNPDITDYFKQQDEYNRTKRKFQGLPLLDPYPEPSPQLKSLIDQYNNLPKGDGPLKKDGTPSSPTRANWIKANPTAWAAMTDQWNKQFIYNLQKEAGLAVFEGIDLSPKTLAKIGMGTSQQFYNAPASQQVYLTDFLKSVKAPENFKAIQELKLKPVKQYKVKLPAVSRQKARIKLQ